MAAGASRSSVTSRAAEQHGHGSGLERPEERGDVAPRVAEQESHPVARLDAALAQEAGEALRLRVGLGVGQARVRFDQAGPLAVFPGLAFETVLDARVGGQGPEA
jgi:hypothetical protein